VSAVRVDPLKRLGRTLGVGALKVTNAELERLVEKPRRQQKRRRRDADLVPPGYFDRLAAKLRTLPDAVEAPGEDPEPMI
jgi:hypothetical protein